MARSNKRNLREECVHEGLTIIAEGGVEALNLRELARRLHVSHQAPYKHFASRDHLLAEIVARAFSAFAAHLDARPRSQDPHDDLGAMGQAYMSYALEHPLHYRLMFGTPLPTPHEHPGMMREARHAFSLLRDGIDVLHASKGRKLAPSAIELDALFVWSTMHGLASILPTSMLTTLELTPSVLAATMTHTLSRVSVAIGSTPGGDAPAA